MNELQILKSDITQSRVVESELDTGTPLVAGEVLLKVGKVWIQREQRYVCRSRRSIRLLAVLPSLEQRD